MPYQNVVYEKSAGLDMPHSETDLRAKEGKENQEADHKQEEDFEKSVRQIYYYQ